jgi:sporadic carbohydrate cluster 2OG-Fe(II) oxygenase
MDSAKFIEQGFAMVPAENLDALGRLREQIAQKARELVKDQKEESTEEFLNNFHRHGLQGGELNQARMALVNYCSEQLDVGPTLFEVFSDTIMNLIGPDILVQKTTNLVIQQPGDPDVVPTHRDSPANSPFEIIIWLPLVDVFGTKSMYMLNRDKSRIALDMLSEPGSGYEAYNEYAAREAENLEIPYGQACFFWPGLVHGCHLNGEGETRWALNIRYKNLFSPVGDKGLTEYFDLLRISPLAQVAFEYQREVAR